jgi:hypothetical protein
MKTRFTTVLFLALIVLISSCKKEEVEEPLAETEPVFRADGTIGGESFSMIAGKDNFFMHTKSEKIDGVDFFYGTLADGVTELEMGIYDGKIDLTGSSIIQDLPEYASVAMNPSQPLVYLSKDLFPNKGLIEEIKWYVDDLFVGINSISLNKPGKFNVCAVVTFNDGSSSSLCNEMIVGFSKNAVGQIRHLLTDNGSLQTWIEEGQFSVQSIKWFVDGVYVTDAVTLAQNINQENHLVTAEINFSNGVKRTKSVLIDGTNNGYFIDDFSFFENNSSSVNWDFNTSISLKINGKQYLSKTAPNQTSTVHITEIKYYGKNDTGKSVFKISADVICNLKEVGTNVVLPFNCSTVFGVEID